MSSRIEESAPREQVGAKTGAAYEFQYAEAALACLELLDGGDATCVYCEWHDDFVVERDSVGPLYEFFQVKSRSQSSGSWTMTSFLGVKGTRPRKANQTPNSTRDGGVTPKARPPLKPAKKMGVAERLLEHQRRFKGACAAFAFVTNRDVKEDRYYDLLASAGKIAARGGGPDLLAADEKELLTELVSSYRQRDPTIAEEDVWALVSRLRIQRAEGRYGDLSVAIGLLGQRIYELAEVDLKVSDQKRIANQLLDAVRAKSHRVLDETSLPPAAEVRAEKGITVDDVLLFLPLSPSGYRALRAGGQTDVKQLSRLHRLCSESGMDEKMVELVCRIRIGWEAWRADHLDALSDGAFALMKERALGMLENLRNGSGGQAFSELQSEADSFASELRSRRDIPELDAEHVIGLVFALAASEE